MAKLAAMPDIQRELLVRCAGAALELLRRGWYYASDCGCDPDEFAVTFGELGRSGLTDIDAKWLLRKGFIRLSSSGRRLRAQARWNSSTSLVLTDQGFCFLSGDRAAKPSTINPESGMPRWDALNRTLWFDGVLIKRYRVPAQNQELVLSSFEEEGWPHHIFDPLPPKPGLNCQRRLHDTINRLNRHQRARAIRFYGNGNGRAICWEPTALATDTKSSGKRHHSAGCNRGRAGG